MIIIWGRSNAIINEFIDDTACCEKCGSSPVHYIVNQSYYHFFCFPVFPLAKSTGTYCFECSNSNKVVYSQKSAEFEKKSKTPLKFYIFPLFILIFILINSLV